jgi:hypothetical protein
MEALELLATALVSGAAAAAKDTTSLAVKDAYAALKDLFHRRAPEAMNHVLDDAHLQLPDGKAQVLHQLTKAGVSDDPELLAAARQLLAAHALEKTTAAGKNSIQVTVHGDVHGQVQGNKNQVTLNFQYPPPSK